MQRVNRASAQGFDPYDRRRLGHALEHAPDVRTYRPLQAVLLLAQGWAVREVARVTGARPWAIHAWRRRYLSTHRPDALSDSPRSGRPPAAPRITDARIVRAFR